MKTTDQSDRELEELLPAYVNGTLSNEQHAVVEAYLTRHINARAEVIWLRALRRRMQRLPASKPPGELGWQRLRLSLREAGRVAPGPGWWKPAMAAAALIIAVQAAILVDLRPWEGDFRPLSGPVEEGGLVQVQFHPSASMAEIRELLLQVDGRIVDGPSAVGLYRVRIGSGDASAQVVADALSVLHANGDLVDYAAVQ
jgi:anti-sigma factor RsiW